MSVTIRAQRANYNTTRSVWLLFHSPVTPQQQTLLTLAENEAWRTRKAGTMYKNILLPTDGSELADKAVKSGIAFAKETNAKITVLTVSAPFHVFTFNTQAVEDTQEEYRKRMQEHITKTLQVVAGAAKAAGVACEAVHLEHEHPYQAIIDTAKAKDCDLIIMASHGRRGISAIVLGSETLKVLTHSKIPVLVHR
jgi:nucleotide-binding universal stress UspA family protein